MAEASPRRERARIALRWLLVAAYIFAGIAHVRSPGVFLRITPAWVLWPYQTIIVTGLCEIAGAIGLLIPRLRTFAAIMLSLYAVCVFPANIKHMIDFAHSSAPWTGWLYHGPRMLFQPVIVWWTLFTGGLVDWPFRTSQRQP
jgi:uncharacterized membrane protein